MYAGADDRDGILGSHESHFRHFLACSVQGETPLWVQLRRKLWQYWQFWFFVLDKGFVFVRLYTRSICYLLFSRLKWKYMDCSTIGATGQPSGFQVKS